MSRVTETPEMAPVAPASKVPSALGVLAALGVPAWACLLCFTDYEDRLRICHIFAGREGPELHRCREALTNAFKVLQDTEINYEERAHLHDTFSQMTHSLEEIATAQGSFEVAFPDAVEKVQKVIMQLKEAPPCIPPCGLQEASRRFRCRGCYSALCDLPLDCPVQDVTVTRGHQALFSCTVDFPLPKEEISYSWKFAAGASDPGPDVLPRLTALERVPGAHPAGAARAPGHLLLRDRSRPEAAGAALLLPERDRPAPAQGDQAAGRLPGRAALGAAGGGGDGALEAQPGRAAGLARGPDAPKPAPDGRPGGLRSRLCHHAGMVSPGPSGQAALPCPALQTQGSPQLLCRPRGPQLLCRNTDFCSPPPSLPPFSPPPPHKTPCFPRSFIRWYCSG
ncbi:sperm acrosome membrane-associated protein 6 isoform X4 [Erinaceus europaeus]|uniref:Sperm acrosome membrane-associated protein 6 isoform X4 n=1 Tax=Erinaceus europaeus TaxID=9365 RepID=A0ABM3W4I7_ERIEU|nr:sperm acrosome membrane-associated protein 6 isoform X4 [Erinaceus europaeus]XP_060031500.1 sperm acrosome membrane-associated protein 6 isoform X4 [Erinaceus europaeus]